MSVGTYLSGTGHAALVVWMVTGWGMAAEPLPFEVADVSVVSGAEFAALTQGARPDLPPSGPVVPDQPPVPDTPPVPEADPVPQVETPPDVPDTPVAVTPPIPETPPEAPDLTVPETIVTDTPPDVPDTPQIIAPPQNVELGTSTRPVPRPAPRVAPEVIAPPPPDATVAPQETIAATEQADIPPEDEIEPADETTAPEAAADQIVTEAEEPSFAPEISRRPPSRPAAVAAAAQQAEQDAINAALNAADAGSDPDPVPTPTPTPGLGGGDLSSGDKASILRQIGGCWVLGAVSTSAMRTSVTVRFSMDPGGILDVGSIRMTDFSGGSQADADVIFRASKSALVRCRTDGGRSGYDVPADQFQTRRDLQLVFDPSQMGLR